MPKVLLQIKGYQSHAESGEEDEVNLLTQGTLTKEDGVYVIAYTDTDENGGEDITTRIKVDGNSVIMQKCGGVQTEFVFEQSKLYETVYKTVLGEMSMSVLPTLINTKLGEKEGNIDLEYVMNIAGVQVVNRLSLSYQQS